MDYYSVKAQFGHVGKNYYIIKTVAVYANNGKDAAFKVRWMRRVKHNRLDAIMAVKKISQEEYQKIREITRKDPYFSAHSRQEQTAACGDLSDQIIRYKTDIKRERQDRVNKVKYKMKKNKTMNSEALNSIRSCDLLVA